MPGRAKMSIPMNSRVSRRHPSINSMADLLSLQVGNTGGNEWIALEYKHILKKVQVLEFASIC
jgi:hypothetical protein